MNCKVKQTGEEVDMGYFKVLSYGFIEETCKNTFRTHSPGQKDSWTHTRNTESSSPANT
jgi:hypothetical protein